MFRTRTWLVTSALAFLLFAAPRAFAQEPIDHLAAHDSQPDKS